MIPLRSLLSPRCWLIRYGRKAALRYASTADACRYCLRAGSLAICAEQQDHWLNGARVLAQRTCWQHLAAELLAARAKWPDALLYVTRARSVTFQSWSPIGRP